jgi:serine/threonine-protein kinase
MKHPLHFLAAAVLFCIASCIKVEIPTLHPHSSGPDTTTTVTLTITSISPTHGAGGTTITIAGTGFSATGANDIVNINGQAATVISAGANSLVVTIPVKAGTGPVTITVASNSATGPVLTYDFAYVVSTYAGGTAGFADGNLLSAQFKHPTGICIDPSGNLYISDGGNYKIRKIAASGVVSTLAGSTQGYIDGTPGSAQFEQPMGLCMSSTGTLYIVDQGAQAIRSLSTPGGVTTVSGGGEGYVSGSISTAEFDNPAGICMNAAGTLFVADASNSLIRGISATKVFDIAGNPNQTGSADGSGTQAQFNDPFGICTDGNGNFYVADTYGQKIRKVTGAGVVTTIAGSDAEGAADGTGAAASFFQPVGICIDAAGNLYVADTQNHLIRKIATDGTVTTIAGTGSAGNADGVGTAASFNTPFGICVDAQGTLYVADTYNNIIRKLIQQ